jgi:hypothetical protein
MSDMADLIAAFSQVVEQRNVDCAAIAAKEGERFINILANSLDIPVQWSVGSPTEFNEFTSRPGLNATSFEVNVSQEFIDLERKEMRGKELTSKELETKQRLHAGVIEDIEFASHSVMETTKFKFQATNPRDLTVMLMLHMYALLERPPILIGSAVCEYQTVSS